MAENRRLVEELGLEFRVLSDSSLATITAYGLIHRGAGMGGGDIARPAIILVGPDGTVRWRNLTESWRIRVQPDAVITAVRESSPADRADETVTPGPG